MDAIFLPPCMAPRAPRAAPALPAPHHRLRPDTYIGSTEKQQQVMWVHDGTRISQQNIGYVPGLYKIFDEILVNAADNKVRDPSMDTIKVDIDVVGAGGGARAGQSLETCTQGRVVHEAGARLLLACAVKQRWRFFI